MNEALMPTIALPRLIVDAGAGRRGPLSRVFRRADRQ
jgi:hypothetical protein